MFSKTYYEVRLYFHGLYTTVVVHFSETCGALFSCSLNHVNLFTRSVSALKIEER